jgi:hypothetical protein
MSGREAAVAMTFHQSLFKAAMDEGAIEMNVPTGGGDQKLNADNIFARNEFYFMVEFKSHKNSLKNEDRKPRACDLCRRLVATSPERGFHDKAHFAAWGHRPTLEEIPIRMGIYRHMVCNEKTLSACACLKGVLAVGGDVGEKAFLRALKNRQYGLKEDEFIEYLKWLLQSTGKDGEGAEFPLDLFGGSFSATAAKKLKLEKHRFSSYDAFKSWANRVIANNVAPPPNNSLPGPLGGKKPGI